MSVVCVDLA